jgi:hypothetical protein
LGHILNDQNWTSTWNAALAVFVKLNLSGLAQIPGVAGHSLAERL